jgi:hypothetical protein
VIPGCTWRSDTVTCRLKDDQAGWVRVVAQGHASNPVPITMWKPTITWINSGSGQQVDLKPIFRADIHRYRETAIDPAKNPPDWASPKSRDAFAIAPSPGSTCHMNGLWQVTKDGKGVNVLDTAYDNNASSMKGIVFLPVIVPDGDKIAPITRYGTCNAGGWFDPTGGAWKFDFGVAFLAPSTVQGPPDPRQFTGPSGQTVAQANQMVQGMKAAAGPGGTRGNATAPSTGGPAPDKDDGKTIQHSPLYIDLMQYSSTGFRATGPPALNLDPASADDRERAKSANFKAADWKSQLTDPPQSTLTIDASGFNGLYPPDDKLAR